MNQENQNAQIVLAAGNVSDRYGQGNLAAAVSTKLMYRAVTRGQDLIAWWPFDDDPNNGTSITGKTSNERTANLYNGAAVTSFGKFGQGVKFDRNDPASRITIDDGKTVGLGNNWTFAAWVKNPLPPVSNLRSTLFRGHHKQEIVIMIVLLLSVAVTERSAFLMAMMEMVTTAIAPLAMKLTR